jgi:hypothetical protein
LFTGDSPKRQFKQVGVVLDGDRLFVRSTMGEISPYLEVAQDGSQVRQMTIVEVTSDRHQGEPDTSADLPTKVRGWHGCS